MFSIAFAGSVLDDRRLHRERRLEMRIRRRRDAAGFDERVVERRERLEAAVDAAFHVAVEEVVGLRMRERVLRELERRLLWRRGRRRRLGRGRGRCGRARGSGARGSPAIAASRPPPPRPFDGCDRPKIGFFAASTSTMGFRCGDGFLRARRPRRECRLQPRRRARRARISCLRRNDTGVFLPKTQKYSRYHFAALWCSVR